jgi:hypothetical protein
VLSTAPAATNRPSNDRRASRAAHAEAGLFVSGLIGDQGQGPSNSDTPVEIGTATITPDSITATAEGPVGLFLMLPGILVTCYLAAFVSHRCWVTARIQLDRRLGDVGINPAKAGRSGAGRASSARHPMMTDTDLLSR